VIAVKRISVTEHPEKSDQSDAERIEELRLQVQTGSYQVPAEIVADDLIDAHQEE
jgi:anti-sigma28 factor (negative regulator of flagellin synthesis)